VVVTTGAISRAKLQSNHHHLFGQQEGHLACKTLGVGLLVVIV